MIKTKATLLCVLIGLVSCNFQTEKSNNKKIDEEVIEHQLNEIPSDRIEVFVFDSCEYLILKEDKDDNSSYGFMAHKGNCKNPIHQCN